MNLNNSLKPFLIVGISALFYLFMFFTRVLPTVMTQDLMLAFNSTGVGVGALIVSFVYAYALIQIPSGMLIDRFGPRNVMLWGIVGCAVGSYAFQATNYFYIAILARALTGFCCGAAFIAPMTFVKQWLPERFFTPAAGCIQLLGCVGAMLAQPCANLVLSIGWRDAVFLSFLLSLALFVMFFFILEEKRSVLENTPTLSTKMALSHILFSRHYWHVGFLALASWAAIGGFSESWGVTYLSTLQNISVSQATAQMNWCWMGVAISSPLVGVWCENTHNRSIPLITVFVFGVVSLSLLISAWFTQSWVLCILLFTMGISAGAQPIAFKLVSDISPPNMTATAISFCNVCVIAGAFMTQPIISYLLAYTWDGNMLNSVPVYNTFSYQSGFLPIIFILLAAIVASLYIYKLPVRCHEIS